MMVKSRVYCSGGMMKKYQEGGNFSKFPITSNTTRVATPPKKTEKPSESGMDFINQMLANERMKYDLRDITLDTTNYKPVGIAEYERRQQAWKDLLNKKNPYQKGGKLSYTDWKIKFGLEETPNYNLKRAWELGYNPDSTGHLPSVDNQTGIFLKTRQHPTVKKELDWFNSNDPEAVKFRTSHTLDSTDAKYYKYIPKKQQGGVIKDPMGQWNHPGEVTRIPGNQITMEGVNYPVLGKSNSGQTKLMLPGENHTFDNAKFVDEYPLLNHGGTMKNDRTLLSQGIDATLYPLPFAKGGKIRIKPENRGKFTASAKRAGESVQEHASSVLNNPNASATQKKRANFARNAAEWNKKQTGGSLYPVSYLTYPTPYPGMVYPPPTNTAVADIPNYKVKSSYANPYEKALLMQTGGRMVKTDPNRTYTPPTSKKPPEKNVFQKMLDDNVEGAKAVGNDISEFVNKIWDSIPSMKKENPYNKALNKKPQK